MATPTGQIALSDCNTEIMQRGAGTYCPITDPSDRLGYGGQRDMAQLRKAWGATLTDGTYVSKFGNSYGYQWGTMGALNDYDIAPGVICNGVYTALFVFGAAQTEITDGLGSFNPVGGWNGTDVDRMAYNNVNRGITFRANYYFQWDSIGAPIDGAGAEPIGIKFYA